MPINWTIAVLVYRLFRQVSCEYEPVTLCTPDVMTHHHRMQILPRKPHWSNCLNESHRKGNPFHLHLRPQCVTRQFILGYKHGKSFYCLKWETSILLARVMTLSGSTLSSYYICSSNPFMSFIYSGALVTTFMSLFVLKLAGPEIELALALSYSIFNNNW